MQTTKAIGVLVQLLETHGDVDLTKLQLDTEKGELVLEFTMPLNNVFRITPKGSG